MCARDPQLKERGFWPAVSTKKGVTTHVTGIPFKLSGGSGKVSTIAPEVGEDFDYVLGELLGLGKSARDELSRRRRRLALTSATKSSFSKIGLNGIASPRVGGVTDTRPTLVIERRVEDL